MIEPLVLLHNFVNRNESTLERITFWLKESRTPAILQRVVAHFAEVQAEREAALLAKTGADETQLLNAKKNVDAL